MSKLFFKPPAASNPSPKSFIKLLAGTAMIFPLGKRNKTSWPENGTFQRPFETWSIFCYCILFPRGRFPFSQHREWRLLGRSNPGSWRFTDFSSLCQIWLAEYEMNFLRMLKKIGPGQPPDQRPGQRSRFSVLTKRSAATVATADITLKRLVTISNGTILTFWHCKVNETLFIQELQLALNVNVSSGKLLSKAFLLCHFNDSFRLKRGLKFLLQMFSV